MYTSDALHTFVLQVLGATEMHILHKSCTLLACSNWSFQWVMHIRNSKMYISEGRARSCTCFFGKWMQAICYQGIYLYTSLSMWKMSRAIHLQFYDIQHEQIRRIWNRNRSPLLPRALVPTVHFNILASKCYASLMWMKHNTHRTHGTEQHQKESKDMNTNEVNLEKISNFLVLWQFASCLQTNTNHHAQKSLISSNFRNLLKGMFIL